MPNLTIIYCSAFRASVSSFASLRHMTGSTQNFKFKRKLISESIEPPEQLRPKFKNF